MLIWLRVAFSAGFYVLLLRVTHPSLQSSSTASLTIILFARAKMEGVGLLAYVYENGNLTLFELSIFLFFSFTFSESLQLWH